MGEKSAEVELLLALMAKYDKLESKVDLIVNNLLALSKEDSILAKKRGEKDERIHDALNSIKRRTAQ